MSRSGSKRKRKSNLLTHRRPALNAMFTPRSVAVIGATENPGSVGRALVENLKSYDRPLYPVNLKRDTILELPAFPRIGAVPNHVDLAIIATPATTVPDVVKECAEAGVTGAIILSAGFRESGRSGAELEEAITARRGQMRIVGPNCLGIMIPRIGLNATFTSHLAKDGHLAFVSQSGAICSSILDWSIRERIGFSGFFSLGGMLDVGWADLIYYLADDWRTESILIYMESVGDARAFLSAAREVALTRPIIVLKVGRTTLGAKAVMSHTGRPAGSDEIFDAAFRRAGILRVNTLDELFAMAEVLGKQPQPRGSRLAIVTNGGGPGALAADALADGNGSLAELSEQTIQTLNKALPSFWSRSNPVDVLGDAKADQYAAAVEALIDDPNNDGILVLLSPQATAEPMATAERLKHLISARQKPILACWMGGNAATEAEAVLNAIGIPTFTHPDAAARAFYLLAKYSCNLRALYETPVLLTESPKQTQRQQVEGILAKVRKAGRTLLTELEAKQILSWYAIPVLETQIALSEAQTVSLKAVSANAVELFLGKRIDADFGPMIIFGAGGQVGEFLHDRAIGFLPLNATSAKRLIERAQIYAALNGSAGRPQANLDALEKVLIRFGQLVAEQPVVQQIEVNPLVASPEGVLVLNTRMMLSEPGLTATSQSKLLIRPYPTEYVHCWNLADETPVTIRPIRPEDEPLMITFHQALSEETLYFRYFGLFNHEELIRHERLVRICFSDCDREITLVAERIQLSPNDRQIIAVARLIKAYGANSAELAIVVADDWQCLGLGTKLLGDLLEIGRKERLERIFGHILPGNYVAQRICRALDFELRYDASEDAIRAEIELQNQC
jgi:acetyltransferase